MDLPSMLNVSLLQLQLFISVAELGSFSKAAEANYMEQSTLSRRIAKLEEQLRVQLFHRSTRPISLTQEGQQLYQKWKPMIQALSKSIEEIYCKKKQLNIYLYDYLKIIGEIPALRRRLAAHGCNNEVEFFFLTSSENWRECLYRGEADIVITLCNNFIEKDKEFFYEAIRQYPTTISMLKTNPLSKKVILKPEDLKDQQLITIDSNVRPTISDILSSIFGEDFEDSPRVIRTVNSAVGLTSALHSENEIVLAGAFIHDFSNPLIKTIEFSSHYSTLCAVWKKQQQHPLQGLVVDEIKSLWGDTKG